MFSGTLTSFKYTSEEQVIFFYCENTIVSHVRDRVNEEENIRRNAAKNKSRRTKASVINELMATLKLSDKKGKVRKPIHFGL